jgi:hypothetical protein
MNFGRGSIAGLTVGIISPATACYCGDGIRQTIHDNIIINGLLYVEDCDDGHAAGLKSNGVFGACSSSCTCNNPGFVLDLTNTSCVCQQNPELEANATEDNQNQGALNQLTITIRALGTVTFDYARPTPYIEGPMIIQVGNLTGTGTSDGVLNVSCHVPGGNLFPCGLEPAAGSEEFRLNQAFWSQVYLQYEESLILASNLRLGPSFLRGCKRAILEIGCNHLVIYFAISSYFVLIEEALQYLLKF